MATIFALCVFNLITIVVFAQEGPDQDEAAIVLEAPVTAGAEDPNRTAERALPLGEGPARGGVQAASGASVWSILRILLTLALAAAAIYGIVYLIKRFGRGNREQDPFLKVLASVPLGANRSAYVIAVGADAWLVGSAEHGVNLISKIEDKETLDAMLLEDSRRSAEVPAGAFPDFRALLQRLGGGDSGAPGPDNIRKRRERLKGL